MELSKIFFANISVLITFAYLLNLVYKLVLSRFSNRIQHTFTVVWFILAGWMTMFFGFQVGEARFDLRYVPLILAVLVFPRPYALLIIGVSTGLLRLTFGVDPAGWAGFINQSLLGVASALLAVWFNRRRHWSIFRKALVAVLAVNVMNIVNIAVFGVIPLWKYLNGIAPISFTTSVLLSFFFFIIIHDFQTEQNRMKAITRTNRLLRIRTDDLHAAKLELEHKADQLEQASKYKSEFLANMSHELKTPLNSIMLLSQMQTEPATTDDDRIRYADMIHQSGQDLLGLVNDILDLSKVEAGKLDVNEEPVLLAEVVQSLDEQFRPFAEQRGLDFKTLIAATAPEWLRTDPFRLNQILRNLLVNACKFTDQGVVELNVSGGRDPVGTEEAVFRVIDTGIGIEADKREMIFESFRQEDGSISRKYGGSGLGLAISRQLAELLGGRLDVESEKGRGSCFTLSVPMAVAQNNVS